MRGKTESKAVIWDLDGVIADTGPFHLRAWLQLAEEMGRPFTAEDFRRVFGLRNSDIIKGVLAPDISADQVEAFAQRKEEFFRARVKGNIKPLPGVLPLLHSLRENGFRLGLASSTVPENIKLLLSALGIEQLFDCLVSGQDVSRGKPDPEGFLLAAKKLGVEPRCCVVIEDAIDGVRAAKAAGMKCIAVANSHPRETLAAADLTVESLETVDSRDIESLLTPVLEDS
jgi:beta-phosphoglucomutase family hydrolase